MRGPSPVGVEVGAFKLWSLIDAVGVLGSYAELFPQTPAGEWARYREAYGELFSNDGEWRLPFSCFVVRSSELTVLVDLGVGPPRAGAFLPERQGWLPSQLGAVGIAPEDIDVCLLTHLHVDHIGWALDQDANPRFPGARYLAPKRDLEWLGTRPPHELEPAATGLMRLDEQGLIESYEGVKEILPGVTVESTYGHTPGHSSVWIRSGPDEAVILGDVAVHPAQLDNPSWAYTFDVDPEAAADARGSVVEALREGDQLIACGHYPGGGIGRLTGSTTGGWQPLDDRASGGNRV